MGTTLHTESPAARKKDWAMSRAQRSVSEQCSRQQRPRLGLHPQAARQQPAQQSSIHVGASRLSELICACAPTY